MPTLQARGILLAFFSRVLFQTILVSGQTEVKRNYLANLRIRYDAYNSNRPVSDIFPAPIRLTSSIDYRATPATAVDPKGRDPKIHMTVPKLITSAGYGHKSYTVNTSDGYILTMFRVFRIECMVNRSHTPVLLQHGFLGSAADWFLQDGDKALPFMLANNGFDVWVGNSRGNEYSMGHKTLDSGNPFGQFWNFSFHEMGTRDLPAMIDFILNKVNDRESKNKTAINYVGHGLGTTMMYVCLAEYPCKYNKKVQTLVSLAPQALLSRTQAVFPRKLAKFLKHQRAFGTVGRLGASDLNALSRLVVPELCQEKVTPGLSLCDAFYYLFTGVDFPTNNVTMMRRVLGHVPNSTSKKTLLHILQHVDNPQFREFDYGEIQNFLRYGQTAPPKYNLFQVNVQNVNVYTLDDEFVDFQDSNQVITELGTTVTKSNFLYFNLSHTDFLWGDLKTLTLNVKVIEFLRDELGNKNETIFKCEEEKM